MGVSFLFFYAYIFFFLPSFIYVMSVAKHAADDIIFSLKKVELVFIII